MEIPPEKSDISKNIFRMWITLWICQHSFTVKNKGSLLVAVIRRRRIVDKYRVKSGKNLSGGEKKDTKNLKNTGKIFASGMIFISIKFPDNLRLKYDNEKIHIITSHY